jgi:hypothetical protein
LFISSSEDDEDEDDADGEDSEYESGSSDSELDEGCANIKLAVPLRKKSCPHKKEVSSTDEVDDDDSDEDTDDLTTTSGSSDEDESTEEEVNSVDEFSGSESNSECNFTDSEGKPNPFHKVLTVPSISIDASSPEVPGMRRYPEDIIESTYEAAAAAKPSSFSASRFQYKTPNVMDKYKSDDLKKKDTTSAANNYVGRSTQRAFNLKKHWVSEAPLAATNKREKSVEKSEIDNRLKSLMDRLSNQQKLLKPADKPSTEMEHFMTKRSNGSSFGFKAVSTDHLITSPPASLKSPSTTTFAFNRQTSETSGMRFTYPAPYQSMSFNELPSTTAKESPLIPLNPKLFKDIESIQVPEIEPIAAKQEPLEEEEDLEEVSEESEVDDDEEEEEKEEEEEEKEKKEEEEEEEEVPPPIPPIPDIYIDEHKKFTELEAEHTNDDTFESCNDSSNPDQFLTPANELSLNPEDLHHDINDDEIPLADADEGVAETTPEPLATSTPGMYPETMKDLVPLLGGDTGVLLDDIVTSPTESEKSFIFKHSSVKLTEDEIMTIYQDRNPHTRLAKFNSLKRKQSSLISDMIMSNSNNTPGSSDGNRSRTRRTRVAIPSSSVPPVPTSDSEAVVQPPVVLRRRPPVTSLTTITTPVRASTEPPVSLPATPLTDPAKFGIPVARNAMAKSRQSINNISSGRQSSTSNDMEKLDGIVSSEDGLSMPNSPLKQQKSNSNKKSLMQTISGIFKGTTRMASPELDSSYSSPPPPPITTTASNNNSNNKSTKSDQQGFMSKITSNLRHNNKNNSNSTPTSSPEAPRAKMEDQDDMDSVSLRKKNAPVMMQHKGSKLSMRASHPSTPPMPLSRKITITRPLEASEDSMSDDDNGTSGESLNVMKNGNGNSHVPPEILEKLMKRGGSKTAKRSARMAHLKRVRKAQEIQRQLEELDVMHKELEDRGIEAERSLRGEIEDDENNADLMQTWFLLLAEKNALVRHEQELLVQAKQLELEDKSSRLEVELREHLLLDSRSTESVGQEAGILQELLSIAEQRELLQTMLEKDKCRYQKEDQDIEVQMKAKGLRLAPVRKLSLDGLNSTSSSA